MSEKDPPKLKKKKKLDKMSVVAYLINLTYKELKKCINGKDLKLDTQVFSNWREFVFVLSNCLAET